MEAGKAKWKSGKIQVRVAHQIQTCSMKTKLETNGMSTLETFVKYFEALMAVVYVAAGISLLLKGDKFFNMPFYFSVPLGLILTLYGAFRGSRVYKKYFQTQHENDN